MKPIVTRTSKYLRPSAKRLPRMQFPPLLCDTTGVDSLCKIEGGADSSDHTVVPPEPESLPQVIHTLYPRAVRAENLHNLIFLQLVGGPIQLFVGGIVEVKPADRRVHRCRADELSRILQRVDKPGVPAPGQQDQSARRIEDQRLIVGHIVFGPNAAFGNFDA